MKKMVRLLSVIMIIAMMFSMTVSAFATNNSFVIVGGGSGNTGSSGNVIVGGNPGSAGNGGNLVIGGNPAPSDTSAFPGSGVSGTTPLDATSDTQYVRKYSGTGNYAAIENSSDINVQLNEDFLKCVHDNYDNPSVVNEGTLAFAVNFFGEEIVYGEETEAKEAANAGAAASDVQVIGAPEAEGAVEALPEEQQGNTLVIGADTPEAESEDENEPAEENEAEEESGAEPAAEQEVSSVVISEPEQMEENDISSEEQADLPEADTLSADRKVVHATAIRAVTNSETSFNGGKKAFSSVLSGGTVTMTEPFDICNSTDYRVTIDLNGTTINYTGDEAAFVIEGKSISFTNGTINGDGFYVADDGILNLGGWINISGLDITVNADLNAIYIAEGGTAVVAQGTTLTTKGESSSGTVFVSEGASFRMTGGYVLGKGTCSAVYNQGYFLLNSTATDNNAGYANLYNEAGAAVYSDMGKIDIYGGTVRGTTGIALNGNAVLTVYNGTVTGTGPKQSPDEWTNYGDDSGAAVALNGFCDDTANLGSNPALYAYGGALRSEQTAAIKVYNTDGARINPSDRANLVNVTLSATKIITQQKDDSDYRIAVFTVNGVGFTNAVDMVAYANSITDEDVVIKMGDDYQMMSSNEVMFDNANVNILFDGNGHELTVANAADQVGIGATSGNVTVRNVTLDGLNTTEYGLYGILAASGARITVQDGVYIGKFACAVYCTGSGSEITVNDAYLKESCSVGLYAADNGSIIVVMVKDDCDYPVFADTNDGTIDIRDGWFKRDVGKGQETDPRYKVGSYINSKLAHLKYDEKDKYYKVSFNDDVSIQIDTSVTEAYSREDGTAYIVYDKGDSSPIVFTVDAKLIKVTAVPKDSTRPSYVIYSTGLPGVDGKLRIADNGVLLDCPSGIYDLQFEFANGYITKGKIDLIILPKLFRMYEVPNSVQIVKNTGNLPFESLVRKYCIPDNLVDTYNVADGNNFIVIMSELPDKLAIGSDPNGVNVYYLENFLKDPNPNTSWKKLTSDAGEFTNYYAYILSYADLNNLATGKNYCFMVFDDIAKDIGELSPNYYGPGVSKVYPFVIENSSVSINPTEITWTSVSGTYANFTVKPDVLDEYSVYIDGERVDKGYWTYDNDTKVLAIKASYLKALDKKDHTLEVITSQGKVSATLTTKVGIMPKNLDYHVYGGGKSLSFVASDKINKEGGVWIGSSNPTKLDPSCYVWDSENGFTLSAAFLNRLALGTYYVSAYVWDGTEYKYSTTSFKVISASQASYNPSTGDNSNIFIWLIVLALSAVAIVVIVLPKFKKQKAAEGADTGIIENEKKDEE